MDPQQADFFLMPSKGERWMHVDGSVCRVVTAWRNAKGNSGVVVRWPGFRGSGPHPSIYSLPDFISAFTYVVVPTEMDLFETQASVGV